MCLFIYLLDGMYPGFFPLGATGRTTENKTDSQLAFTADATPPDPIKWSYLFCVHQFPHPPSDCNTNPAYVPEFSRQEGLKLLSKETRSCLPACFLPVDSHSHKHRHRRSSVPFLSWRMSLLFLQEPFKLSEHCGGFSRYNPLEPPTSPISPISSILVFLLLHNSTIPVFLISQPQIAFLS